MSVLKRQPADRGPAWTTRDGILLYTCQLAEVVRSGSDLGQIPEVLAPFPPPLGGDERLWVSGPFQLSNNQALGDGSWESGRFIAAGSGALGMGLLAGSLIGSAHAKSRARAQAAADAVPRWVTIEQGTLFVSRYGWHMFTPSVVSWHWNGMTSASMMGPAAVHVTGESTNGTVSWMLQSDWAELVFILWALARHPRHPQVLGNGWLPPGWVEHAIGYNQPVPSALLGLDPP